MPRNLDLPLIPERSEDPSDDVPKPFSVMMTQCHSVPEVKCVNLPRTVQETIHEECSTEFDQECSTMYKQQCAIGIRAKYEVFNERKCKTSRNLGKCDDVYGVTAIMFSDQDKFRKEFFLGGVSCSSTSESMMSARSSSSVHPIRSRQSHPKGNRQDQVKKV